MCISITGSNEASIFFSLFDCQKALKITISEYFIKVWCN